MLFPIRCVYCRKIGNSICNNCLKNIDKKYIFQKLNNEFIDYVFCGSLYENIIRLQMHSFKFHERADLYKYFIDICFWKNKELYKVLNDFDLITYVPMYYKKEQKRGYNQAKLLAEELGRRLNIKVVNCLKKRKDNKMQSSLSKNERFENVKNVFEIIDEDHIKNSIQNKNIILVDDILTTGATITNCAKILKKNESGKICAFTISKSKTFI